MYKRQVQSWRVNIMMSFELILLPAVNSGLDFLRTRNGRMPCRRSSALIKLWLAARSSPLTRAPRLSVPSHLNVGSSGSVSYTHLDVYKRQVYRL